MHKKLITGKAELDALKLSQCLCSYVFLTEFAIHIWRRFMLEQNWSDWFVVCLQV